MQEARVQFLGQEDPLEKEMATHSSIPAWRIPWTEEPGRLQSTGSQESHNWETKPPPPGKYMPVNLSPWSWNWAYMSLQKFPCALRNLLVLYLLLVSWPLSSTFSIYRVNWLYVGSHLNLGLEIFSKVWKTWGGVLNLFLTSEGSLMCSILKTIVSLILCLAIIALDGNLNIVYYFSLSWRFFNFLIHSLFVLWTAHIT